MGLESKDMEMGRESDMKIIECSKCKTPYITNEGDFHCYHCCKVEYCSKCLKEGRFTLDQSS